MTQPWDPNNEQPGWAAVPGYYQEPVQPTTAQPGYPTGGYSQPGQPPPGYLPVVGYPGYQQVPTVPGSVTAAAVLSFVQGGVVLMSTVVLMAMAEISRRFTGVDSSAETWVVALAALVAGALLIAGGVLLLKGPIGPAVAGSALSLLISIYFLVRSELAGVGSIALSYAVLPIIILAFAFGSGARDWASRPR